jgi:hypothetical protein
MQVAIIILQARDITFKAFVSIFHLVPIASTLVSIASTFGFDRVNLGPNHANLCLSSPTSKRFP